jgi:hypothetical protein
MPFSVRSRLLDRSTLSLVAAMMLAGAVAACGSDDNDDDCTSNPTGPGCVDPEETISQDITTSRTLNAGTAYTLSGFIHVLNGATLTIEPGTVIKGDPAVPGSSLFIMRGARIVANGQANAPIVFTSGRADGSRQPGDWGGIVIVGNATLNRTGAITIEGTGTGTAGTPGSNYAITYGGTTDATDADNSGTLTYVRVEFAGFAPQDGFELNSWTFAAVGRGTQMSYLQSLAGLDDAFEWFGGTVDGRFLVAYETGDDAFDMSEGYRGRLQYLIGFNGDTRLTPASGAGSLGSDPQGIENDGCSGSGCTGGHNATPYTQPVVANFTLVGTGNTQSIGTSGGVGMVIRRGSGGYYVNGLVARWPTAAFSITDDGTWQRAQQAVTPDLNTADLALRNILVVESPTVFQATSGTTTRFSFDATGNAITTNPAGTTTAGLFTTIPATVGPTTTESAFDWTPPSGSAPASGGLATFAGTKLTTAAGSVVAGTSFVGGAPPSGANLRWWAGWTNYARN